MFKSAYSAARSGLRNGRNKVAAAAVGAYALGMSGLASANIDVTGVETALTAAQTTGEQAGTKVIAVVAGLVVVGIIIALVKKV